MSGFLDLGPLGVSLRNLIVEAWKSFFLRPHNFVELSTPIITPHKLLQASGHVENFKDSMTECTQCKRRFRADQLVKEQTGIETEGLSPKELGKIQEERDVRCPECSGILLPPQYFLTMFKTSVGPYGEDLAYARPEAAQGIFVNFKRAFEVMRERFPIGIAQVGTVLRNEISPRQGPIRLREFTIMDFELFFNPEDPHCPYLKEVEDETLAIVTEEARRQGREDLTHVRTQDAVKHGIVKAPWAAYFMALSKRFLATLGLGENDQRFFEKLPEERAHYSSQTFDHEVKLDRWGWVEVAGFAYRADYDLRSHMEATGTDMRVFKAYEKPIERKVITVRPRYNRIRQLFGTEAGRIGSLIAKQEPRQILQSKKDGFLEIDGYKIPVDCLDTREETVRESGSRFIPHVVEPSFGVERLVYATMEHNLRMKEDRLILGLPFSLAPIQVSVFPLVNRDKIVEKAAEVYRFLLKDSGLRVEYDDSGSIGRRYARADEAGVTVGVTIDYDTLKDDTVTLRDRDTWKQIRIPVAELKPTVEKIGRQGF